nr:hypothetical protein [Micromonospora sp. DSM 115978]
MSGGMIRRVLAVVVAAGVAAAIVSPTPGWAGRAPAVDGLGVAVAPPTVSMHCDSGARTIMCYVNYTSATAVQIRWTLRGTPMPSWNDLTVLRIGCSQPTELGVTVSNVGGSASTGRLVYCNPGEWP